MVHTLPVKVKSAMLNIAEQPGIRNARRNGLRPYRTRNNSGSSSAEETAAGQCRRLAGHRPVSVTEEETRAGGMVGAIRPMRSSTFQVDLCFGQVAVSRLSGQVNSTHLSVSDSAICHFPTSTSAHSVRMGNHPINPYQASLLTRQVRRGLYRFLRVCRVCTSQSLPRNGEIGLPVDLKVPGRRDSGLDFQYKGETHDHRTKRYRCQTQGSQSIENLNYPCSCSSDPELKCNGANRFAGKSRGHSIADRGRVDLLY